jgi:hypothetical protein
MSAVTPSQPLRGLSPDAISSLFQAIGGLRNRRALLAMAGCGIVAVLIGALFGAVLGRIGASGMLLTALLVLIAVYTGINAAGMLLMDQARGAPLRSLTDALVNGLLCIPKLIVLGLGFLLVSLVVFIALAIVFFVCKLPWLGPLVFTVAFPLAVVIAGLTISGLMLCMFLALPAIWEGATITHAIAQAIAIVRSRLVETFVLLAVVGLLAFVVGLIVFGVLGIGLAPTLGLSASVIGHGGGDIDGMRGMGMGPLGGMMGMGGGYAVAASIGGCLLWAIAATLVSQVWLLGLNLVYLRVSEGLDTQSTEQALEQGLAEARRKTAEMGHKAKEAAERVREQTRHHATPAEAPPAPAAPVAAPHPAAPPAVVPLSSMPPAATCPSCRANVGIDDMFCGVCGHRLQ